MFGFLKNSNGENSKDNPNSKKYLKEKCERDVRDAISNLRELRERLKTMGLNNREGEHVL